MLKLAEIRPRIRELTLGAWLSAFLLIVQAGFPRAVVISPVCLGCGGPSFFGLESGVVLGMTGRLLAGLTFLLDAVITAVAWFDPDRRLRALSWLSAGSMASLVAQAAFGFAQPTVRLGWFVGVHSALGMLVLGFQAAAAALAFQALNSSDLPMRVTLRRRAAKSAAVGVVAVFSVLISGTALRAGGFAGACGGWPLCHGALWPMDLGGRLNMVHRSLSLLAAVFVVWLAGEAWRERRHRPATTVAVALAASFTIAQLGTSLVNAEQGYPVSMAVLHTATAATLWTSLVVAFVLSIQSRPEVRSSGSLNAPPPFSFVDYLALAKPIIVGLLLVTTLAGMIVAARGLPRLPTVLWTLLGGALSAGGAGAINQYIDRHVDGHMSRTRRRPLPDGRLAPAEVLSFGLISCVAGFYILVWFVNLLSATLALAGMVYYILLYSLVLKRTTVQNIVVGGGAGAIPPLVGWAAASGRLDMAAFFLFALVFFWTPPHFWALALIKVNDYTRAGIPMLPVVRGERETRRQIFLYTVQLVCLTLLLPVVDIGGLLFVSSALILGSGLIALAWRLWREGGKRIAWRMYRYSSMYLAFIFLALVLDTFITP